MPSVVTRVVGDRVEVQANGRFYTLYDFAAQPGDTWLTMPVTPFGTCARGEVQVVVDSVGRRQVGGRSLRWFRMHLANEPGTALGSWSGRVYEQLGSVQYLQPQSLACHGTDPGYMGPMVSFQATGLPGIGYNATTGALLTSAEARATAVGFVVFPNPGAGLLTLRLPATLAPGATLQVYDLTGRLVRQQAVPASHQLDLRALPAGTYTLLLCAPGQSPLARRIVLE
ncbi:T9SS type A sorting domain-containing protein [Hymenobacter sp. BT664]|uniref:T9SS type A sorting domain-containing protein n=1 Tax=Hymenobacter montanus TaxID=2771359 RepID=A0A927BD20_9BACT|nr:T9SS type A sorting domain-containing protein [Hymenobacter montanus]MBD2767743.1 T9SS type A sorting domain-containing protein [Hymenobacter montanus]